MGVALLDVNVLVALGWPNHKESAAAHRWLLANGSSGWATCTITQLGFVRHSVNPLVVLAEATPNQAIETLRAMTASADHSFWSEVPIAVGAASSWSRVTGHKQTTDAYLVELAKNHSGRVTTFDRGMAACFPRHVELISSV